MDWASMIGSLGGGALAAFGQSSANRANMDIVREQEAFQERMADTAHQREVTDLEKAGLNPILSAGGSGAPSPVGAGATMQNVAGQAGSELAAAVPKAVQTTAAKADAALKVKNVSLADAQQKLVQAQQANAERDGRLKEAWATAADAVLPLVRDAGKGFGFLMNAARSGARSIGDSWSQELAPGGGLSSYPNLVPNGGR